MDRLTNKREADQQRKNYEKRLEQGYPRNIPEERFLKLAYYEDLEAEGRLIVLPCKVGDTVYVIDWYLDCDIDGFGVCDDYEKEGDIACGYCRHNYVKKFVSERKYEKQEITDFGKTVFLTREEAEAALAEKAFEQVQDAVDRHNREAMDKIAAFIEPEEGAE